MGQKMLNLLPLPNDIHDPTPNQYNAANSAYETLPLHSRISTSVRLDAVVNDRDPRQVLVRERPAKNNISNNRVRAGRRGTGTTRCRAGSITGSSTQVLSPSMVNEVTVGRALEQLRVHVRHGRARVRLP